MKESNSFEDRMIRQGKTPDPSLQLSMTGSCWIDQEKLQLMLVETILPIEYQNFINAMERLINHPYSYRYKEFIDKYRRPLSNQKAVDDIPTPDIDDKGRSYVTIYGENMIILAFYSFYNI